MTRPVEPTWPTTDDLREALSEQGHSGMEPFCWRTAEIALDLCRVAWLAANDDPSTDLPGTIRISPSGITYVKRRAGTEGPWFSIMSLAGLADERVIGWTRGTPVEGTPAAKAAEQ